MYPMVPAGGALHEMIRRPDSPLVETAATELMVRNRTVPKPGWGPGGGQDSPPVRTISRAKRNMQTLVAYVENKPGVSEPRVFAGAAAGDQHRFADRRADRQPGRSRA